MMSCGVFERPGSFTAEIERFACWRSAASALSALHLAGLEDDAERRRILLHEESGSGRSV